MGMCMLLRRCDADTMARLRAEPDTAGAFAAPQDYQAVPEGELVDLDKAWHAIHFLLSGSPDSTTVPEGALFAGEELGGDLGLGPARLLSEHDTRFFAAYLASKPDDFVEKTLDFAALEAADIYPDIWDRRDAEDIEYVATYFRSLKELVLEAAVNDNGIVVLMM